MFCRLYELKVGTDINLTDHEKCIKEKCLHYEEEHCSISKDVNIHLDSNKFGWKIDKKINLKPIKYTSAESGSYYFDKMIKLIHPINGDIWIFNCLKKDKETRVFVIYIAGKQKGTFKSIEEVLVKMKKNVEYNGRDIIEPDFDINKED